MLSTPCPTLLCSFALALLSSARASFPASFLSFCTRRECGADLSSVLRIGTQFAGTLYILNMAVFFGDEEGHMLNRDGDVIDFEF